MSGLTSLTLQVIGMRHYLSLRPEGDVNDRRIDLIELKAAGWEISIEPVEGLRELEESLNEDGGCAVTHHVRARRVDGSTFDAADAEDLRDALYYFLSFVEGRWVAIILPIATRSDATMWQQWGPWRVEAWQSVFPWADTHGGALLNDAFRGYMNLWHDAQIGGRRSSWRFIGTWRATGTQPVRKRESYCLRRRSMQSFGNTLYRSTRNSHDLLTRRG